MMGVLSLAMELDLAKHQHRRQLDRESGGNDDEDRGTGGTYAHANAQ